MGFDVGLLDILKLQEHINAAFNQLRLWTLKYFRVKCRLSPEVRHWRAELVVPSGFRATWDGVCHSICGAPA